MYKEIHIEDEGLFQKSAALVFSSVGVIINSPLLLSIIIFEKRKHFQTLINQLVSSILFRALFWNIIIQSFTFIRYTFGPLPYCICYITTILQTGLLMQGLLLFDAIVLVRYSFVFHFANPTCRQDGFWIVFINIWTVAISILAQIAFIITPGKNPVHFYICVGEIPVSELDPSVKLNYSVIALLVVSICLHIFASFQIRAMKKKTQNNVATPRQVVSMVDKDSLASVTSYIISMMILVIASYVPAQLNKINVLNFNNISNSLISDIFHHY